MAMPPRKKSLLGASNPLTTDPAFLPALSNNLAALGPSATTATMASTPSAPLANTASLVNKTGTQSLYQRCSQALARLLRIEPMPAFFSLSSSGRAPPRAGVDDERTAGPRDSTVRARQSTDPVRQLWDLLALGVPLCILYNAQPGVEPLQIDTSVGEAERKLANNKVSSHT